MASGKFKAKFPMISHFARWQFTHIRFWYQNFSDAHKIGTLWARDLRVFFKNDHHGLFFHAIRFLSHFSAHLDDKKRKKSGISNLNEFISLQSFDFKGLPERG